MISVYIVTWNFVAFCYFIIFDLCAISISCWHHWKYEGRTKPIKGETNLLHGSRRGVGGRALQVKSHLMEFQKFRINNFIGRYKRTLIFSIGIVLWRAPLCLRLPPSPPPHPLPHRVFCSLRTFFARTYLSWCWFCDSIEMASKLTAQHL